MKLLKIKYVILKGYIFLFFYKFRLANHTIIPIFAAAKTLNEHMSYEKWPCGATE